MATGLGYSVGRFLGGHPGIVVAAGAGLVLWQCSGSVSKTTRESESIAQAQAAAAAQQKALADQEQALIRKCTVDAAPMLEAARADLKAGRANEAFERLHPCNEKFTDPTSKKLLADALIGARAANEKVAAKARAEAAKVEAQVRAAKKREGVRIGMTQDDVVASSWGKPRKINRTTTAYGVREQWVYDGGYLYFEKGILTSVQN